MRLRFHQNGVWISISNVIGSHCGGTSDCRRANMGQDVARTENAENQTCHIGSMEYAYSQPCHYNGAIACL